MRGLHAPRGSPPHHAGTDAWRDTASGHQAEGHPQPAWQRAGWLEVSASAEVGGMKEKRSWRETTSEPKSEPWSDRSPEGCPNGNVHSGRTKKTINTQLIYKTQCSYSELKQNSVQSCDYSVQIQSVCLYVTLV